MGTGRIASSVGADRDSGKADAENGRTFAAAARLPRVRRAFCPQPQGSSPASPVGASIRPPRGPRGPGRAERDQDARPEEPPFQVPPTDLRELRLASPVPSPHEIRLRVGGDRAADCTLGRC